MTKSNCKFSSKERFIQFLKDEKVEIEKHKWIESEKAGYDLGNKAVKEWIDTYAAVYREWWEKNH